MGPLVNVPVTGISVQSVGQFFPHERGMFCRGSLRLIELTGTSAPHDGRGKRTVFMMMDNLRVLTEMFKSQDDHERLLQFRVVPLRLVSGPLI